MAKEPFETDLGRAVGTTLTISGCVFWGVFFLQDVLSAFAAALVSVVVLGLVFWSDYSTRKKATEALLRGQEAEDQILADLIEKAHAQYQNALLSGDKPLALKMGREYYALRRENGELTSADEQAIANDLLAMK